MAVRKTEKGASLKRSTKNKEVKACRPSVRVNASSPKPWGQMTAAEKTKVITAKKKVGMGARRSSKSNVS